MLNQMQTERILAKLERFSGILEPMLFQTVEELNVSMYETKNRLHQVPEIELFSPAPNEVQWGGEGQYCWFRTTYQISQNLNGVDLFLRPRTGGMEGLLWVDGMPFGTFTGKNVITGHGNHYCGLLLQNAVAGNSIDIAVEAYAGHYVPGCRPLETLPLTSLTYTCNGFELCVKNKELNDFYFDLKTFLQMTRSLESDSYVRAEIVRTLLNAFKVLRCSPDDYSQQDFMDGIAKASALIKPLYLHKNTAIAPTAAVIGHSHMDTAWQWTIAETVKKCARTFSNQLSLMKQYPEYRFIQSSAYHSDMMRKHYPQLFQGIKEAVAAGKYEPNGGVWVECDCNLVSGEFMVRQFLWGQRFTREHFDYTSNCFWLPDTFGYSAAIPQIMKGCGIDYFLTTKMAWNDTNIFPYDTFIWKGMDGTTVLAHCNKTHLWPDPETCIDYLCNGKKSGDTVKEKTVSNRRLLAYGFGDGGGGPQFEMVEMARRCADLEGCPKVETMLVGDFMPTLEESLHNPPVYSGELYLELHRGTLTNQHRIKELNRRTEVAIHDAEYIQVRGAWESGNSCDPQALRDLVCNLLVNQFHDILPGTCINAVHVQTIRELEETMDAAHTYVQSQLQDTALQAEGISIVNTLSFPRKEVLYLATNGRYLDSDCRQQLVSNLDGVQLLAVDGLHIPAFGSCYLSYCDTTSTNSSPFTWANSHLTTPLYEVIFTNQMYISSLFDKQANREVCGKGQPLGTLLYGEDIPLDWDNWDIDADCEDSLQNCATLTSHEVVTDGSVEFRLRLHYDFPGGTAVTQDVCFYAGSREIRYETRMDWRCHHRLLKACFDTSVSSNFARHETQFGYVERPTHRNTTIEQAQFEVCNHKYTDLSETRYGVALLNNCKYGISVRENQMRLTLHKGGCRPDMDGDLGVHDCVYTLLPHLGGFSASSVIQPAYALNYPTLHCPGKLTFSSFVSVTEENILVETIKPCEEDGNSCILRIYEAEGTQTTAHVTLPKHVDSWVETNMLEEPTGTVSNTSTATLQFHPFEIKTILLTVRA